jgi:cell fate regulator YaaT (PSP1 superfamily)
MNKITMIQFTPWDKVYYFDSNNLNLSKGDKVVVKTEMGMEIGEVVGFADASARTSCNTAGSTCELSGALKTDNESRAGTPAPTNCVCPKKEECFHGKFADKELKLVLRIANSTDLERIAKQKDKEDALRFCKEMIKKHELPMKLVDVHFSYDGSRITFAFISESRVDFRELVKDLTRHFSRSIRLQQIGIRDEARIMGDYGHCGKPLCCREFLRTLTSITSEMAEIQQCAHRGSDRISGVCGRLMCCLAYEEKGYEELAKKMPPIGTKVNVDGKRGVIVSHHILKQSVDVEFPGENGEQESTIVEVSLNREKHE